MKLFNYNFLQTGMYTNELVNLTNSIYSLATAEAIRKTDLNENFESLRADARLKSIAASNEIEGIMVPFDRLVEIVNNNALPLDEREAQVAGYRDALDYINEHYEELEISEELILELHRMIYRYAYNEETGRYKVEDNVIVEYDRKGNGFVRFKPLSAEETPEAMRALINAYNSAKDNTNINPLMLIPAFILDFSCIHPFSDGTGRVSRLLTILLLYKNGFDIPKYLSLEDEIYLRKFEYLQSLKLASKDWAINKNDYIYVINDFLYALNACYSQLDKAFTLLDGEKHSKAERVKTLIMEADKPISKQEICDTLLDVSTTTIEAVLAKLTKEGRIIRVGQGRASRYLKK